MTPSRPAKFWTLTVLGGAALLVYLLASAPPALETKRAEQPSLSTAEALTMLAYENDVTRTLFTKEIVGHGKPQGLAFHENWTDEDIVAGPLPALFLRGVATELSKSEVPLNLFLGSDYPIESSNLFSGRQQLEFAAMREDLAPRHFLDPASGEHVSMFPDFASAGPCVSCHNGHERSAKSDWKLGDLMGATTWSYPADSVTTDEFMAMVSEYRKGVKVVWSRYLSELEGLTPEQQPEVGDNWPSAGFFIPDHATLRDSINALSNGPILAELLDKVTL
jgi:adenylate cyclase